MPDNDWYVAMGEAVKQRDRAVAQRAQWDRKIADAEAIIANLTLTQHSYTSNDTVNTASNLDPEAE